MHQCPVLVITAWKKLIPVDAYLSSHSCVKFTCGHVSLPQVADSLLSYKLLACIYTTLVSFFCIVRTLGMYVGLGREDRRFLLLFVTA